jgi:transposase-like protein
MEVCSKCKSELKKAGKLNSGNSIFQEWVCPHCGNKTMKALSVN